MTEHLCICCPQLRSGEPRIYERANTCEGCRSRLRAMLAEVVDLYAQIDPRKVTGASQRVSGSRTPPLPLRVEAVDLRLPVHVQAVRDPFEDQVGHVGVATILETWARDWQTYNHAMLPHPSVASLANWLVRWLDDACDKHPAVDDFAAEIRDLIRTLRRTNGLSGPAVQLLDVPCRRCDWLSLAPVPRQDRIECLHCGDLATHEEYRRWTGLLVAGVRDLWVDFDLDVRLYVDEAALLVKVTERAVRLWVWRGVLPVVERDHGRPRFAARDVFEAERRTRTGVVLAV